MHVRKPAVTEEPLTPNLIPMIDVMFLLLLFFLLGADMAAREDSPLRLARADHAQPLPTENDTRFPETVANVHHVAATCARYDAGACREPSHWRASISGRAYTPSELADELAALAATDVEAFDASSDDVRERRVLSRRAVRVRADQQASYGDVQRVLRACSSAGIHRVSLGTELPAER